MNFKLPFKRVLIIFQLLFFWLTSNLLFAQVTNIGKVVSWKTTTSGIRGKTTSAIFDIHAYSENTFRIRVSKNEEMNDFSYALKDNGMPSFKNAVVTEKGNFIEIATSAISVEVEKEPLFRVIFKNNEGEIINEDVAGEGFGTTFLGDKVTVYKKLMEGERFVGLGEVLGRLDKRGMGFTLNNTDTWKYGDPRLPMYVSVPFYIGIHHQQVYGIFFNNTWKTFFNFGLSTPDFSSFSAEGGDADYFFFYDNSFGKIIEQYFPLTAALLHLF